jgi:O-antigen ligase
LSTATATSPRLSTLEKLVLLHVGVLLLGSTWAFGGNITWARFGLSVWATAAIPLTVAAFLKKYSSRSDLRGKILWLLPPALYAVLVLASTFNPSFQPLASDDGIVLVHRGAAHPHLPSTISASASLNTLWFGGGAYLSAFNLALVLRSRAALRALLAGIATNALALAVFGTLQKLSNSGYYFGGATSPNIRYFSTFIYNNHWGAFMILVLSVAIGLLFYHVRKLQGRDLWHSPFSAALLGVFLIAATAPVSASRAATGMAAALVIIAVTHALFRIITRRRRERRPFWQPVTAVILLLVVTTSAIGWLGYRAIGERITETRLALDQNESLWSSRVDLYRDTWTLAERKPLFGWGLNTYYAALQLVRPRPLQAHRQYESSYDTAHNDWLQSLAETGFAGTTLLVLTLALPLATLPRRQLGHPLIAYPLLGLGVVLLYATFEFPFHSGAVLFTFWTLLFTTVRLAMLTENESRSRHE